MQALAGPGGRIFVLYRAAREGIHRDMILLTSEARGHTFEAQVLHRWELAACPMSSAALTAHGSDVLAAWQTEDQLFMTHLGESIKPTAFPGEGRPRKHPALAVAPDGRMLVAYVEGASWGTSGTLVWQVLGPGRRPLGPAQYRDDLPTWSFPAAFVGPDGRLEIIY